MTDLKKNTLPSFNRNCIKIKLYSNPYTILFKIETFLLALKCVKNNNSKFDTVN